MQKKPNNHKWLSWLIVQNDSTFPPETSVKAIREYDEVQCFASGMNIIRKNAITELDTNSPFRIMEILNLNQTPVFKMSVFVINFQTRMARIDECRLGVRFVDVKDERWMVFLSWSSQRQRRLRKLSGIFLFSRSLTGSFRLECKESVLSMLSVRFMCWNIMTPTRPGVFSIFNSGHCWT